MYGVDSYRLLSIDPGTYSLGITISDIDCSTGLMSVLDVHTADIDRIVRINFPVIEQYHGSSIARLRAVEYCIFNILRSWDVNLVASESPYMGRFPAAYAALVSCLGSIQKGCLAYNPALRLQTIDPATVKKLIGVKGNSGDKSLMKEAVLNSATIDLSTILDAQDLDEHSIDSIGVGAAYLKQLMWGIK